MQTEVLIIGGGITGAGIARDLALRGVNCVLAEKLDINAGASGANHGLLHSGARYVSSDLALAKECWEEASLLKRMAPQCIDNTGGLFVAVVGDDEKYVADFPHLCAQSHIPVREVDLKDAHEMEPALSDQIIAVYQVEDAAIDPFKLSMENIFQACEFGCNMLRHTEVIGFVKDNRRIQATRMRNSLTGKTFLIEAEQIVNATGAWAGLVSGLAGIDIHILFSKGSLLVTHSRITKQVVNRLRPSSNADILVPGGTVSILGTTSIRIDAIEDIRPTVQEMDMIVGEGAKMLPVLEKTRYIRAYAGVRPLVGSSSDGNDRGVSRAFALINHEGQGLNNFVTITGGKLTTYRLMAEKTADLVCRRLNVTSPCRTIVDPLPSAQAAQWTEPGLAPRLWLKHHEPEDVLICECEMVPKSTVDCIIDSIHQQNGQPDLKAIGVRSRIGKGACQGTICGIRLLAYLYHKGELNTDQGLKSLREFLRERWRGVRPLLWDMPLIQAEMQEALYCGLFGLELYNDSNE
ncbi:MAG: anaerobic glycerol-3-phosphate dehydrogenase subunit A [Desulfobacterales bacterium]|nr:MAG: anaerobic glycerol-3-phosphate dehydrogenase subunit A [Desulfobacterales bacterium]